MLNVGATKAAERLRQVDGETIFTQWVHEAGQEMWCEHLGPIFDGFFEGFVEGDDLDLLLDAILAVTESLRLRSGHDSEEYHSEHRVIDYEEFREILLYLQRYTLVWERFCPTASLGLFGDIYVYLRPKRFTDVALLLREWGAHDDEGFEEELEISMKHLKRNEKGHVSLDELAHFCATLSLIEQLQRQSDFAKVSRQRQQDWAMARRAKISIPSITEVAKSRLESGASSGLINELRLGANLRKKRLVLRHERSLLLKLVEMPQPLLREAVAEHVGIVAAWAENARKSAKARESEELTVGSMARLEHLEIGDRLDTSSEGLHWISYGRDSILFEARLAGAWRQLQKCYAVKVLAPTIGRPPRPFRRKEEKVLNATVSDALRQPPVCSRFLRHVAHWNDAVDEKLADLILFLIPGEQVLVRGSFTCFVLFPLYHEDLGSWLRKNHPISEMQLVHIVLQMLLLTTVLSEKRVLHRDLQLKHFLLIGDPGADGPDICLAGFERLAKMDDQVVRCTPGNALTTAPELRKVPVNAGYQISNNGTKTTSATAKRISRGSQVGIHSARRRRDFVGLRKSEVWAVGVLCFHLVSPFSDHSHRLQHTLPSDCSLGEPVRAPYDEDDDRNLPFAHTGVSPILTILVQQMLCWDPHERVSAEVASACLWRYRELLRVERELGQQIKSSEVCLELDPACLGFTALRLRGEANRLAGQYAEAVMDLDAALAKVSEAHGTAVDAALNMDIMAIGAAFSARGYSRRELGQFDSALEDLDIAVELNDCDVFALAARGELKCRMGCQLEALEQRLGVATRHNWQYRMFFLRNAIEDLNAALALEPDDAHAWVSLASAKAELGMCVHALQDLDAALALDRRCRLALTRRGEVNALVGQREEAILDLDEAIRRAPRDPRAWLHRAQTKAQLGRYFGALDDFEVAISLESDHVRILALADRSQVKIELGQHNGALHDLNAALAIHSDTIRTALLARRGVLRLKLENWQEALQDFQEALDLDATNLIAIIGQCEAKHQLGKFSEVVKDATEALRFAPTFAQAFVARGDAWIALRQCSKAIDDFDAALVLQPDLATALSGRGTAKRLLGRCGEAIVDFDAALTLEPRETLSLTGRGVSKGMLGRFDEAISDLDLVLARQPTSVLHLTLVCEAKLESGAYLEALQGFEVLLDMSPSDPFLLVGRAESKRRQEQHIHCLKSKAVMSDLHSAERLAPGQPFALKSRFHEFVAQQKFLRPPRLSICDWWQWEVEKVVDQRWRLSEP